MSTEATSSRSTLPPVRRIVTGHTPEGKSTVLEDAPVEPHAFGRAAALFTDLYWTDTSLADNSVGFTDLAKAHEQDLFSETGSSFRVVDTPPGKGSLFHRTVSLDYGIVMQGSVVMLLDDDKRVHLKAGDVVIQRGTIHGFLNEGSEWSRIYAVMLPAQKVKVGEKELETEFRPIPEPKNEATASTESTSSRPSLTPVRRVVTGHTPEGKSTVLEDAPVEPHTFGRAAALFTDLYWTDTSLADNSVEFTDLAKEHEQDLFSETGSSFRVVDTPPGKGSLFHRTVSLDYGIVMQGSVAMLLDDGKRVHLKAGDVVIQRGTIHGFLNEGSEWSRIYAVMLPAQKVRIGEKELETEFRPIPEPKNEATASTESTSPHPTLPSVRRIVTGHTLEGKSTVLEDAPIESHGFGRAPSLFTDVYWTDTSPANNTGAFTDLAKAHAQDLFSAAAGSSFRVVDTPPGKGTIFHRTVSLDYGIVMQGTVTLLLDDNRRVQLKAGDVVVQRGTIHGFLNEGSEWSRMYAIMLPAQKVKIGNIELETEFRVRVV